MKYKIYCNVRESFNDGKAGYLSNYDRIYFLDDTQDKSNTDCLEELLLDTIIKVDGLDTYDYEYEILINEWDFQEIYVKKSGVCIRKYIVYRMDIFREYNF